MQADNIFATRSKRNEIVKEIRISPKTFSRKIGRPHSLTMQQDKHKSVGDSHSAQP
jgi:hypothetical protein